MKKAVFFAVVATLFISALAMGDKNLNKIHKGMMKDGNKVNCVFCHKGTDIPRKGQEYNKFLKTPTCAGEKCHK